MLIRLLVTDVKSPITDGEFSESSTPWSANSEISILDTEVSHKPHIGDFPNIELFKSPGDTGLEIESAQLSITEGILKGSLLTDEPNSTPAALSVGDEEDFTSFFERMSIKPKKYAKRLFLGEADFSYTVALLKKHEATHPELLKEIITTELATLEHLHVTYPDTFPGNLEYLRQHHVDVQFGVDATQIHKQFKGQRIKRIHFNFPHDGSNYKDQTLPEIIGKFFLSARQIQKKGDRIYVALPYLKEDSWREKCLLGNNYRIYKASVCNGYQLIKKRGFKEGETLRYNGYQHRETKSNKSASSATQYCREYIFERMFEGNLTQEIVDTICRKSPSRTLNVKKSYIRHTYSDDQEQIDSLTFLDTDNDSSAYEDTDTE